MAEPEKMTLRCPDCGSRLVIDRETGEILFHKPERAESAPGQDFDALIEKLDDDKAQAENLFEREIVALKNRDRLLEDKFEQALQEAKESPEDEPPLRPFDLD